MLGLNPEQGLIRTKFDQAADDIAQTEKQQPAEQHPTQPQPFLAVAVRWTTNRFVAEKPGHKRTPGVLISG
jgi:hypothetical protein